MIHEILDIFPSSWKKSLPTNLSIQNFDNLQEFKQYVKRIEGEDNEYCDCTYKEALNDLLQNNSQYEESEYLSIKKEVESKLIKRGLITTECYENFKYSSDGVVIDVDTGKYINGEPDCIISPSSKYIGYFYELYISVSYPYWIEDEEITYKLNQICAVLQLLEKEKIYVKVNIVVGSIEVAKNQNYFSVIPVFSHNETKNPELLTSVINSRLLRKFYFSIWNNIFTKVSYNKGTILKLEDTIDLGKDIDPVILFEMFLGKA